ncbi:T9SS type B sorting domain-containing protein [Flavobacteriaceae bacterium R38]|nr:T9SS type B sorting domain-containing protein [Flavobacteriaceae bacterium R38]
MKKLCIIFTFFTANLYCQITVDDTSRTSQQLVEDVLINSSCATTSNYKSSTGTSVGINGIGYFERNGSNFPFENGIVLSTGRATNVVGPNENNFSGDGVGLAWFGDSDLENITQTATTQNASYLEFDFVPSSNSMSFNFLFASEEYYLNYPCQFSDVFAFILTDSNGVSRNLAVIPGTNIPVKVTEIHEAISGNGGCEAKNEQFFDTYNDPIVSAISMNGQTVPMTASADVVPGERYTIKLVIADFQDGNLDSSVFIEGGSFTVGASLGEDRTIANGNPVCEGNYLDLNTNITGAATYVWRKDGVVISGENNAVLRITETGTYSVDFDINGGCIGTDEIFVEFVPPVALITPSPIEVCSADGDLIETFDLTLRNEEMRGNNVNTTFNFYETQADVTAATPIINFKNYRNTTNPQQIVVEGVSEFGCKSYTTLTLSINQFPTIDINPESINLCDTDNDGIAVFDLRVRENDILNGASNVELYYYRNRGEAATGDPNRRITVPAVYENEEINQQIIYVRAEAFSNSCSVIFPLELNVIQFPALTLENEYSLCLDANENPILPLNAIETGLNSTDFSFTWYTGTEAIEANRIPGESNSSLVYQQEGNYTVKIINTQAGCELIQTVGVRASYAPVALDAEVISRPFSGNNEIVATVTGNGNYLFSLDGSEPQSTGNFVNVPAGNHIITVFDEFNCGSLFQELLIVDYPRFFTPNGDNMNDIWDTSAFSTLSNLEIHIFDRYGKLLKVIDHRENGWDGTFNGSPMPSDDYWFNAIFSEDNVIKQVKGHFALKR